MAENDKPLVVITGSEGNIGTALRNALQDDYQVVGLDREGKDCEVGIDLTDQDSVQAAFDDVRKRFGSHLAAVVHLAAYFDFTGEESPLYDKVNVEGTRHVLRALQDFTVDRFIYSSTMLVHAPCAIGETVDESAPVTPKWAYPQSKAKTEQVIEQEHGNLPYVILRLAGLYDETMGVPTLTQQIARIFDRDLKSHLYAGNPDAGQAFIHKDDMISLFKRVIERRHDIPENTCILAGETEVMSYEQLQDEIGRLVHGEEEWRTLTVPEPVAKAGAWLEEKSEPLVPDAFDEGEKPFIRPFMIDMASDHYALDTSKAQQLLDWRPQHRIADTLPALITGLKQDPAGWHQRNKVDLPTWMEAAEDAELDVEQVRTGYEERYRIEHRRNLWAHFLNIGLGFWLITAPFALGYESTAMIVSDVIAGILVVGCAACCLSPAKWMRIARFDVAFLGLWVMCAPLLFWAPTAAAYLNGTLVGALLFGFALLTRPFPLMSPTAAMTGPEVPPGWNFSPSSWFQRLPVVALAFVGFYISRYLTAYQLGHIDAVWEPFFGGDIANDGRNGTEEIITSSVSEAWPVPDAGLGALTYMLEILTGLIGSSSRWRTMPWLVLLFGIMIIPLGFVSITFIIIQPILLGTWCTLCLFAALAMLLQIPYSFDEIMATIGFLRRRAKAGYPWLKILFTGDTDEGDRRDPDENDFRQPAMRIVKNVVAGGITAPWTLVASCGIGIWLMFTRVTLGSGGGMANADHLIGSLVITFAITAFAEVVRAVRFVNIVLGIALLATPFIYDASTLALFASLLCGVALILLSLPRGPITSKWGEWEKIIV